MYGLLLEGIGEAVKRKYGESTWQAIRKKAGITHHAFITHKTYSETVIPRLTKASHEVTNAPVDELMEMFGTTFVSFVSQYGYDRVMRVLGRNLRDFLNGLDNLHEYLRFSYPKLKPPSFFCENESRKGLTLHYRSKRKGFLYYVMGQITQVAKTFYNTNVEIELMSEEETLDMTHVVMKLQFDNAGFKLPKQEVDKEADALPISSDIFFDVFPFHIVFNRAMVIKNIGSGLAAVMSHVVGQAIDEMFMLTRPMVEFTMENVMNHANNVFEMLTIDKVKGRTFENMDNQSDAVSEAMDEDDPDDKSRRLRLKGQMMYMTDWDAIIFLGTPIMENLERMFETGLYINDLSMHDSSRDLVLAGTQQSAELKLALDQEQQKSKKLEESMKRLDIEMKRTDQLLYQMIPKAVADRLRRGEPAMATCETFKLVTILFSDVVGFTNICSKITPLQVVGLLNGMYTQFDQLSEKHRVYKVETIGDAYMVVSGAPVMTTFHSLYICDMAFDMMDVMTQLIDPHSGDHLKIRVGVHSGTVVAGVVGVKMPRYCLFGETVNAANRMEAQGTPMKIHISETTKDQLAKYPYTVEEHKTIEIKGGTILKTYFLTGKDTTMGSALNYMKDDAADMEGNTNTSLDIGGKGGGGGGGGGGGSGGGGEKGANLGKQAPAFFAPPVYDHDVIADLNKSTDPYDEDAGSVSSKQRQKPIGMKQELSFKKQSRSKEAETPPVDALDEAEELKMANDLFTETKKTEETSNGNKSGGKNAKKEVDTNDTNLEKAQIEEKTATEKTATEKDPTFHPSCMWLEMVFLMAEAQENGIPPHEFFKSIYGENNQSGVPQCAFYKAFAEGGHDVIPATG